MNQSNNFSLNNCKTFFLPSQFISNLYQLILNFGNKSNKAIKTALGFG